MVPELFPLQWFFQTELCILGEKFHASQYTLSENHTQFSREASTSGLEQGLMVIQYSTGYDLPK